MTQKKQKLSPFKQLRKAIEDRIPRSTIEGLVQVCLSIGFILLVALLVRLFAGFTGSNTFQWQVMFLLGEEGEDLFEIDQLNHKRRFHDCVELFVSTDSSLLNLIDEGKIASIVSVLSTDCIKADSTFYTNISSSFFEQTSDSLGVKFRIDYDKINRDLENKSHYSQKEELAYLLTGNYLNYDIIHRPKLRTDINTILFFTGIFLLTLGAFLIKLMPNEDEEEDFDFTSEGGEEKHPINSNGSATGNSYEKAEGLTLDYSHLRVPSSDKAALTLLIDINQQRNTVEYLQNRSTLMLILSLTFAMFGLVLFYFSIPNFAIEINAGNYFAQTIKPVLILIFAQSLVWFFLKQYRITVEDYKYFHKKLDEKKYILTSYMMLTKKNTTDKELIIVTSLLTRTHLKTQE